jgi:hypothetical protein
MLTVRMILKWNWLWNVNRVKLAKLTVSKKFENSVMDFMFTCLQLWSGPWGVTVCAYRLKLRTLCWLWSVTLELLIEMKQDMQCTYNVTFRLLLVSSVALDPMLHWKSNKYCIFRVYVCSRRDSAWNAHAPYCHLASPALLYFSTFLINGTIFLRTLPNMKSVWFSLQLLSKTFITKRIEPDMIKNVYWPWCKVPGFFFFWCKWNLNFLDRFLKNAHT